MSDAAEQPEQQFMSIEKLRDEALELFDQFITQTGFFKANIGVASLASMEEKDQFLTLAETEAVVRDHAVIGPGVYAVGGETKEAAMAQIRELLAALVQRVMSNVLRCAAGMGLVDVAFDDAQNDFMFAVSEKGKKACDRAKNQIETSGDFDPGVFSNPDADD